MQSITRFAVVLTVLALLPVGAAVAAAGEVQDVPAAGDPGDVATAAVRHEHRGHDLERATIASPDGDGAGGENAAVRTEPARDELVRDRRIHDEPPRDRLRDHRPCPTHDRVRDCCRDRAADHLLRRCRTDLPVEHPELRMLIWRLINAHEWQKLVRLLHAYHLI